MSSLLIISRRDTRSIFQKIDTVLNNQEKGWVENLRPSIIALREIFQARIALGQGYGYYEKACEEMLSYIPDAPNKIMEFVKECLQNPPDLIYAGAGDF